MTERKAVKGWPTWLRVVRAFVVRLSCYGLALRVQLYAEARPAPTLPDAVLALVPYVAWVDRYNYLLWLLAYVPLGLAFWWKDVERFIRYMETAGLVALARGACIWMTGLGPVNGHDVNAGMTVAQQNATFWKLLTLDFFSGDSPAHAYLTKDLFFSGHTATTFLLLLYVWPHRALRWPMLAAHVLVVLSVFFSHLHYTIDVVGAYAITFCVFWLREGKTGKEKE